MKLAIGILCYKRTKFIDEIIEMMSDISDIYIHIDKKSNLEDFKDLDEKAKILANRVDVNWGEITIADAMLNLLEATRDYDYVSVISEFCLPLKTPKKFLQFLEENKGTEFIGIQHDVDQAEIEKRMKFEYSKSYYKKEQGRIQNKILNMKEKLLGKPLNKYYESLPKLYKGPNWFTITGDLIKYIFKYLEENEDYRKAFEKSMCADEIFFQTIVMNSPYKEKLYKINMEMEDNERALRYIDWKSGPEYPKVLDESDFEKMREKDYLFGRKFNTNLDLDQYRKFVKEL